jgi:hypothetical protein
MIYLNNKKNDQITIGHSFYKRLKVKQLRVRDNFDSVTFN